MEPAGFLSCINHSLFLILLSMCAKSLSFGVRSFVLLDELPAPSLLPRVVSQGKMHAI